MAADLITLEQALGHERADAGIDDADAQLKLNAAIQFAVEYLNRKLYASEEDMAAAVLNGTAGDSPMLINDLIRAGILLIFGDLYQYRENTVTGVSTVSIPIGAKQLLQPYRAGLGV